MASQSRTKPEEKAAGPQLTRDGFTTGLGVLAATLGSAVGLGNIWKFPALTGMNGGAAFILVYLLCTLLVGLPVMIAEQMLGRRARANAIQTFRELAPGRFPWWITGVMGFAAAFLIMGFYTEVAGWVFAYIVKSATGAVLSTDPEVTSAAFVGLITNPLLSLVVQWAVLILIGAIIMMGVSKGIERTTKRLMPVLFGLLVLVGLRSLTLPGAGEGVEFLFRPDFSAISGEVVLIAMGLAFFKLSLGMGTMLTYGSYFREDQNIPLTATRVMLADLTVSLLAGIAIFPAVFAFGFAPDAGPSLLFETIPAVFASMPLGSVFMVLFFVLCAVAATGAMLSLLEVPVAILNEQFRLSRRNATLITLAGLAVVGSLAALSSSITADLKLFGMNAFNLYDYTTSNILLPLGGLLICVFVGWVWGYKNMKNALSNNGALSNERIITGLFLLVKFVAPVLILIIMLNGLGLF
ncbi:MAG: sodium-dependent transporter [Anaerolineae bacterium]|nr:sodium-dependent transporter [Anaerolineae bacterium]